MIARMVAALFGSPGGEPWPASVVLEGEYGIDGVALSVPVMLGDGGAAVIYEWDLTPEQAAGMRAGAEVVRAALAAVDLA
jgi:malate dehydrogenase